MLRLFVEDMKDYMCVYDGVSNVYIKKIDNKNNMEIRYTDTEETDLIPLNEIRLSFLVDINTMHEYFRYEK